MATGTYMAGRDALPVAEADGVAGKAVVEDSPMPLTCRWPKESAPLACVVFCHGLGACGQDYAELSRYWASHGYLVIHPTFPDWIGAVAANDPDLKAALDGRDPSNWMNYPEIAAQLLEILHTPSYWLARVRAVRQLMDGLDEILEATCGRLDKPLPAAIAGHSFGAYTSQLFAGVEIDIPGDGSRNFRDERFSAAILISAQGRDQQGLRQGSWDGMTGPVLTVTGTLDRGARGQDHEWKSEPHEFAPPDGKYLAVLEDADHFFGGLPLAGPDGNPAQRDAISQLTLAFLDAYLLRERQALEYLVSVTDRIGNCPVRFKRK